jgi:hypothetical protein
MQNINKKQVGADELRRQLSHLRNHSLTAVRRRDFRAVARLTVATAQINRQLLESTH